MDAVFSVRDRQVAFDYILSTVRQCGKIISLVQVGSGAKGYHDDPAPRPGHLHMMFRSFSRLAGVKYQ